MKTWRLSDKLTFWGIIISVVFGLLGLLFGQDLLSKINASTSDPQFQYVFEGAFDPKKPEYEVAFPLGWNDSQKSNAHIWVHADYGGDEYAGITYIKIRKVDNSEITVGQWDDFRSDSEKQQDIPLSFNQLFQYAGLGKNLVNLDVSTDKPALVNGQFTIFVENAGQSIPGSEQTITVYNTPWFHRTYLDNYEVSPGERIKAYVEVINYGADAEFSVATCSYRIVTPSYQVDPTKTVLLPDGGGWWPDLSGNLQRVCDSLQQTPVHFEPNENKTTVQIELPENATAEHGFYDYIVYVSKKLPILDYNTSDWTSSDRSRDGRQHSTYVVIGR